jgi:hypothetical protein
MDINLKIKLESPQIIEALLALAEEISKSQLGDVSPVKEGQASKAKITDNKIESKKEEIKKEKVKTVTLEEVRAKLVSLSQAGKQPEVKALIVKYGGNKLTDLDQTCYEELLKEAEVL